MLVHALHIVTLFLPASMVDRVAAAASQAMPRRGEPDRFVRGLPQLSRQWLADHRRAAGKGGDPP